MTDHLTVGDHDAFTVGFDFKFDVVSVPRNMAPRYWSRVGWGTVNHTPTKRQRQLCLRNGHPRNALVTRNGVATCARCASSSMPVITHALLEKLK